MATLGRSADLRSAAALCGLSVAWNVVAGSAAVVIGLATNSLALAGFGLNAAIDSVASATLIWRFLAESRDPTRAAFVERVALRVVGITLLAIASYIVVRSVIALVTRSSPETSTAALAVAVSSVFALVPLAYGKWRLASRLDSQALRGDSVLSAVGAALALVTVLGLVLSALPDWWWTDAVVALLMSAILYREGFMALQR